MPLELNDYILRKCSIYTRIRDKKICQLCLNKFLSNQCQAHHIKPKAEHPELAYELSNLITLCKKCHHRITHSDIRNVRRFLLLWWPYLNRKAIRLFNKTNQSRIDDTVTRLNAKHEAEQNE